MQIMRFEKRKDLTTDYENTEIVHIDKDTEDQITVYTNGGEFYIAFSRKDVQIMMSAINGRTVDELQEIQTLRRSRMS